MNVRQSLVDDWTTKLADVSREAGSDGGRFVWVRQIYARIYRFLTTRYGDGEWRSDERDSVVDPSLRAAGHAMSFVDNSGVAEGVQPKRSELIRKTLDAIHESSPGIATPGTANASLTDIWVAVAAFKKASQARALYRRLTACRIEAGIQHRAGDTAVLVRHEDFQDAMTVVQRPLPVTSRKLLMIRDGSPASVVGSVLLAVSLMTLLVVMVNAEHSTRFSPWPWLGLWFASIAAAWLCFHDRDKV